MKTFSQRQMASGLLQKSNVSVPGAVATGSRSFLNNKGAYFALRMHLDPVAIAPGTDTINHTTDFCSKAHGMGIPE